MFYKTKGSFEKNTLNVECVDFLIMDLGESTFTDFVESPEIIAYMVDNDLLDCYTGLIHSHNNMNAFFSGTDTSTLLQEGSTVSHFVSLIVCNKGPYVAAITRKVNDQSKTISNCSYSSFKNKINTYKKIEERESNYIEYFPLIVECESPLYKEIYSRFQDIENSKKAVVRAYPTYHNGVFDDEDCYYTSYYHTKEFDLPIVRQGVPINTVPNNNSEKKEDITELNKKVNNAVSVITNNEHQTENDKIEAESSLDNQISTESSNWECVIYENIIKVTLLDPNTQEILEVNLPLDLIKGLSYQYLTGSILMKLTTKVDIDKFINNVDKIYAEKFDKDHLKNFVEWARLFSEFLCTQSLTYKEEELLLGKEIYKYIDANIFLAIGMLEYIQSRITKETVVGEYFGILLNELNLITEGGL